MRPCGGISIVFEHFLQQGHMFLLCPVVQRSVLMAVPCQYIRRLARMANVATMVVGQHCANVDSLAAARVHSCEKWNSL